MCVIKKTRKRGGQRPLPGYETQWVVMPGKQTNNNNKLGQYITLHNPHILKNYIKLENDLTKLEIHENTD
jgi:hypothetical protein